MADRQRGVQIHRPVIYGSHARLLTDTEKSLAPPGRKSNILALTFGPNADVQTDTHRWTVFFTSATSGPPKTGEQEDLDILPGGHDDLTYLVKRVTFRLHETYPNPSRVCDKPPFLVTETGWGEFSIQIRVQFVAESVEKPLVWQHALKLHHWGPPIEGPIPGPSSAPNSAIENGNGQRSGTPVAGSGTPAPEGRNSAAPEGEKQVEAEKVSEAQVDDDGDVKMETSTPQPSSAVDAEVPKSERGTPGPRSATPSTRLQQPPPSSSSQPLSIASKIPVLSWQYDEIVFCDPPLAFYNLLNEHPPTPLPARNRRPRDQREEHESNKKSKKAVSAITTGTASRPSISRQATAEVTTDPAEGEKAAVAVGTPAGTTAGTPAPPTQAVGIPGEAGSADVPLEFSYEMERGEWNKLHEAKRKIIEETDKWRSKLIEEEKEMARLKEEMSAAA